MEVELEPAVDPEQEQMMTDEQFDAEVALAAEGRWEELGLDELPDNWQESTIEDLRNVGSQ